MEEIDAQLSLYDNVTHEVSGCWEMTLSPSQYFLFVVACKIAAKNERY